MTIKERILARLGEEREILATANPDMNDTSLWCRINQVLGLTTAQLIVMEEFAKEGEESNHLWIIEFRTPGGKWQIFDMDGDRSQERAESYIPSNQVAYPDCEFRVVKYQRVEGE